MSVEIFGTPCTAVDAVDVDALETGKIHRLAVRLVEDGAGRPLHLPVIVARGREPGPVFGLTAAVHGNELNGIRVIHQLFRALSPDTVRGTVIGCPVVNVPALIGHQRTFREGLDLNRLMPGKPEGNVAEVYAWRLTTRVIDRFDYLVDLHTASFGRINSLYVRADLRHPVAARMAMLQHPEIVVHNQAADGTLRAAAMERGIPAITVEVGDPLRFQRRLIRDSLAGVRSVMAHLGMIPPPGDPEPENAPIVCVRSYWIHARHGGLIEVLPGVTDRVQAGERIARVRNVFGDPVAEYHAPEAGVVVGRSTNPVGDTGARLLHLGIEGHIDPTPTPPPFHRA